MGSAEPMRACPRLPAMVSASGAAAAKPSRADARRCGRGSAAVGAVGVRELGCDVIKHDGTRGTLAGMPATVHLRHHRKRIQNAPESIVWNCSCGFMTWRPRTPKSAIVQLQKAWARHLTRRTPGNRRQLAVRPLS